jgi:CubicO group peptidase (beta-lactamase class C family)
LIERASGEGYAEFLRKRIFVPLGMTATRANDLASIIPGRALGYQLEHSELQNAPRWDPSCAGAAGALISNVPDLAKWVAAQENAQVLSKPSIELMRTPAKLKDGRTISYGLGCLVSSINGHRMVRYTGGIPGFTTTVVDYPDDALAVIVLTNLVSADAEGIAVHIGSIYEPELDYRPVPDAEPDVTEMIRKTFAAWADGKATAASFAPAFWKTLNARQSEGGKTLLDLNAASLRDHGPIRAIHLLQREERDNRFYRYRIDYEKTSRLMWFELNDEGKIVSFGAASVSN